jgi:hypothetical protein
LCSLSSAGCASGARRRWGEEFVLLLLKSKYKRHDCRWVNRHGESGRPYDLTLQRSDTAGGGSDDDDDGDDGDDGPGGGGGDGLVHVEVKSTTQGPEDAEGPFPISIPELLFAAQRKERYQLFRVFRAGTGRASVLALSDFYRRLTLASQLYCQLSVAAAPGAGS